MGCCHIIWHIKFPVADSQGTKGQTRQEYLVGQLEAVLDRITLGPRCVLPSAPPWVRHDTRLRKFLLGCHHPAADFQNRGNRGPRANAKRLHGERRKNEVSEPCRLRWGERYEVLTTTCISAHPLDGKTSNTLATVAAFKNSGSSLQLLQEEPFISLSTSLSVKPVFLCLSAPALFTLLPQPPDPQSELFSFTKEPLL